MNNKMDENNIVEIGKKWSIFAIVGFVLSLLPIAIWILYFLGINLIPSIFNMIIGLGLNFIAYLGILYSFSALGIILLIINIIALIIVKKHNKKGAGLSITGIILSILLIIPSFAISGIRIG